MRKDEMVKNKIISTVVIAACLIIGILPLGVKASEFMKETYIRTEYVEYIEKVCKEKSLCPELVIAIVETESAGDACALSSAGCMGLMQLNPRFFKGNLFDYRENIDLGTDYLIELFEKYGDLPVVLTAYNCGEFSKTTQNAINTGVGNSYADKVMKRTQELERIHGK